MNNFYPKREQLLALVEKYLWVGMSPQEYDEGLKLLGKELAMQFPEWTKLRTTAGRKGGLGIELTDEEVEAWSLHMSYARMCSPYKKEVIIHDADTAKAEIRKVRKKTPLKMTETMRYLASGVGVLPMEILGEIGRLSGFSEHAHKAALYQLRQQGWEFEETTIPALKVTSEPTEEESSALSLEQEEELSLIANKMEYWANRFEALTRSIGGDS